MIIATLIIGVIGLYLSFIMMKNGTWRVVLSAIFGVIMIGSLYLVNANDRSHFGMEKVTTTKTVTITSASPSKALPMLLHQDVGTSGKRQVYIYKVAGKTTHTKADYLVSNHVVTGDKATVKSVKTAWVYKNDFYKSFFANQNNHKLIKQVNTITIPKTWTSLSTKQAKALAKRLKAAQNPTATQKAQMTAAIQQAVVQAKMKNPSMTAAQQKQVIAQAKAKLQQAAIQQAIKAVKAE
ncbi:DUF4811 domain-containing protein [Lacticaseibacillus porcinae]|uniref:DUF4811 domain-containing protein n=1 Tax=Lacticaseibacillus porcinae TaxID=1123687 RepID=UPI000F772EBD|nr:DUF4811 domain-containing protein [Lacticaseibacillus porcinae]